MVQQKHFTYASVVSGVDVAGYMWEPEEMTPKLLLVISHGMSEGMTRYEIGRASCRERVSNYV